MSQPSILIALYKYFPYGGLQKDTLRAAEEAHRRGCRVVILCTAWDGPCPAGIEREFVKPSGASNTAKMASFGVAFRNRTASWEGITLAMNRVPGADFYFAADSCMAVAIPQARLGWLKRFLPRYKAIIRQEAAVFSSREKTRFLLISEKQREDFTQVFPDLPAERFEMLPPGIDERCSHHVISPEKRAELRSSLGVGEGDRLLVTVGTNLLRKGVDRVLETLQTLPENVHYLLIGNTNPASVEELRKKIGVSEKRFHFLGPRNDVCDWLCAADMMVHPAREEGAGSVLLEGLSCGLPVICTKICGFSPYISEVDARNAIPEPFQQEALNRRVRECLEDLVDLKAKTVEYGATHDFTVRTKRIVDIVTGADIYLNP